MASQHNDAGCLDAAKIEGKRSTTGQFLTEPFLSLNPNADPRENGKVLVNTLAMRAVGRYNATATKRGRKAFNFRHFQYQSNVAAMSRFGRRASFRIWFHRSLRTSNSCHRRSKEPRAVNWANANVIRANRNVRSMIEFSQIGIELDRMRTGSGSLLIFAGLVAGFFDLHSHHFGLSRG
jgi:hypothetical protein